MSKIKGLLKLLRFELPFSAGVCVVMGQMLALGEFASYLYNDLWFCVCVFNFCFNIGNE